MASFGGISGSSRGQRAVDSDKRVSLVYIGTIGFTSDDVLTVFMVASSGE